MHRLTYLFVLLAICFLAIGMPYIQEGTGGRGWPTVDGKILHSSVVSNTSNPLPFTTQILYQYKIGETIFHGDRIGPEPSQFADRAGAQALVAEFPVGATVKVFYHPKSPERSLLRPAFPARLIWFMVLSGTLFAAAIVKGLRSRRQA